MVSVNNNNQDHYTAKKGKNHILNINGHDGHIFHVLPFSSKCNHMFHLMGVSSYLATDVLCVYMLTHAHQQHEPNVCSHLYSAIAWWHVSKMLWKIDWLTSPWQIKKIAALSYGLSLSMLLLYCLCETDHPLSLSLSLYIYFFFLLLPLFFMSWTQRSNIFSMYTKGLFISNIENPKTSQYMVWPPFA